MWSAARTTEQPGTYPKGCVLARPHGSCVPYHHAPRDALFAAGVVGARLSALRGRLALYPVREGAEVSNAHVWWQAQERLRKEMTKGQYDTWLHGTQLRRGEDGTTVLYVRTTFDKESLDSHFRERIEAAISDVTGRPCTLRILVGASSGNEPVALPPPVPVRSHLAPQAPRRRISPRESQPVDRPSLFSERQMEPREPRHVPSLTMNRTPVFRESRESDEQRPMVGHAETERQPLGRVRSTSLGAETNAATGRGLSRTSTRAGSKMRWRHVSGHGLHDDTMHGGTEQTSASRRGMRDGTASMERFDGSAAGGEDGATPDPQPSSAFRDEAPAGEAREATPESPSASVLATSIPRPRLNPRYTFSTFIVGSGNRLAHAASQAVAEAPGQAYNPLFLYGGVGLGKTHLLHAVGHTALERDLTVLYVSSETFTNEIINAILHRTTEEFRAKYRSVDVLLVDDIQFIAGKDSTEEEFFHTFNSLYESNKQIVICSDRPPQAIVSLAERLRSRFEWGLIADIQPPDLETRVAILRAKAEGMHRPVPDEVIDYLASRVQSNIRELEGSLNRLLAFTQLQSLPLNLETAKAAMTSVVSDGMQRRVSIADVLGAVAEYYHVSANDLCGKQRDKHIVVPRQVAMYLMRQETEASLLEIGQALGGRDHSTVLHGCEKIGREVNENSTLRKEVLAIRQQLLG